VRPVHQRETANAFVEMVFTPSFRKRLGHSKIPQDRGQRRGVGSHGVDQGRYVLRIFKVHDQSSGRRWGNHQCDPNSSACGDRAVEQAMLCFGGMPDVVDQNIAAVVQA